MVWWVTRNDFGRRVTRLSQGNEYRLAGLFSIRSRYILGKFTSCESNGAVVARRSYIFPAGLIWIFISGWCGCRGFDPHLDYFFFMLLLPSFFLLLQGLFLSFFSSIKQTLNEEEEKKCTHLNLHPNQFPPNPKPQEPDLQTPPTQ